MGGEGTPPRAVPAPRGASAPSAGRAGSAAQRHPSPPHTAPPSISPPPQISPPPPREQTPRSAGGEGACEGGSPAAALLLPFPMRGTRRDVRFGHRGELSLRAPRPAPAASAPLRARRDGAAGTGLCSSSSPPVLPTANAGSDSPRPTSSQGSMASSFFFFSYFFFPFFFPPPPPFFFSYFFFPPPPPPPRGATSPPRPAPLLTLPCPRQCSPPASPSPQHFSLPGASIPRSADVPPRLSGGFRSPPPPAWLPPSLALFARAHRCPPALVPQIPPLPSTLPPFALRSRSPAASPPR